MAGDWIKFETSTSDKPEVWMIANALGLDPDAVVGKLLRVWVWFDEQSINGNAMCNAATVTKMLLDRKVSVTGFCDAVICAGWMIEIDGQLQLPNFDRHNGQTAKTRAKTAKRVQKHRNATCNGASVTESLPEKRRVIKAATTENPKVIDSWEIPERLNTGEVRELLEEFEDMRRKIKKPIKSLKRASRVLIQFDDVEHLVFALTTCVANDYQGLKPEYKPSTNGKHGKQPIDLDKFVIK